MQEENAYKYLKIIKNNIFSIVVRVLDKAYSYWTHSAVDNSYFINKLKRSKTGTQLRIFFKSLRK